MKPLNDILDNFSPTPFQAKTQLGSILWQYDFPVDYVKTRIMLDVEHEDLDHEISQQ